MPLRRPLSLLSVAAVVGGALLAVPVSASASAARAAITAPSAVTAPPAVAAPSASTAATNRPQPSRTPKLPAVYPVPQSMKAHGGPATLGVAVALVATADADQSAVDAVNASLSAAGVTSIDKVATLDAAPGKEPAVVVGGDATATALGVTDASALAAEGYVLATGKIKGRTVIALDGHDATGTYYAAQTFRQLLTGSGKKLAVPGVQIRDWPALPIRGVIEGFYGTPWSHAARLSQLDFYGAHKMDTYVYSPKDDPYLRAQWRDPYPADQLAQLKELVTRATADHVNFTYAVSPGLSVCYSSAADEQALVAKFQSLWDIGVRDFAIPLDDISYTTWNCDADKTKFGTGGAAAGAAQSYLLNAVQRDFIATHAGVARLQMVPTEYSDTAGSVYKTAIKAQLDPAIIVEWTGVGVIAPVITRAQAAAAKSVFGHDILLWDNYPVNDYVTGRLLLGPYVGRDAGLGTSLVGNTANPMIQPEASKIALFSVADYSWNDTAFDPQTSWQASITELSGGDRQARAALAAFADLEHYSRIDTVQAPVLAAKTATFWQQWEAGSPSAAYAMDRYLSIIATIPTTLAARMNDPAFIADAQPWLAAAGDWGKAARAALQMLRDERLGHGALAVAERATVNALVTQAKSHNYVGLGGAAVPVSVGDGVIDTFVTSALAENDRWLGLAGRHVTGLTSMSTYQTNTVDKMVDGDDSTYYWTAAPPAIGDYIGVDLGGVQRVSSVAIHMGKPGSPNDFLSVGVVEYSVDGVSWTTAATTVHSAEVQVNFPAGAQARFVRLRSTASQTNWVVVREFTVTGPDSQTLTVSGTPGAATGSSLAAAADGSPDSVYRAASAPAAGDALVVALPTAKALQKVAVLGTGSAAVQIGSGNNWTTIGSLAKGYTELPAHGQTVDRIRLLWAAGSAAPQIAEVIPWYADTPAVDLVLPSAAVEVTAGMSAAVPIVIAARRPSDTTVRVTAKEPRGVTVRPAGSSLAVLRGGQPTLTLTITGRTRGSYQVPITVTPRSGGAVTGMLAVNVHPAVSDTNVAAAAAGATATASSVEQNLPQFTADHAIDGDLTTRWSSGYHDNDALTVKLAAPQHLGKVVLYWETAHATDYLIQTSADGASWTTAATVSGSQGGIETEWIDQTGVRYLRMQGVHRSSTFGYSLFELQAYPVA